MQDQIIAIATTFTYNGVLNRKIRIGCPQKCRPATGSGQIPTARPNLCHHGNSCYGDHHGQHGHLQPHGPVGRNGSEDDLLRAGRVAARALAGVLHAYGQSGVLPGVSHPLVDGFCYGNARLHGHSHVLEVDKIE